MEEIKVCTKCSREFPATTDYFYRRSVAKDNLQSCCKKCSNIMVRTWEKKKLKEDPNYLRRMQFKIRYGITISMYNHLLNMQGGVCAICGNTCASGRRLSVDHDHKNNRIRGLLCNHCNNGLGKFKDDPELLEKAVKYLKRKVVL